MKNIILLGANGHIGAYTFDYLIENINSEDFNLVASGRRDTTFYSNGGHDYVKVDICNNEDFNKLPQENVFAVINFAGIMPATMNGYDPQKYIDINVKGTFNVLEYCRKVGCDRIISTTTEADLSGYWEPGAVIGDDLPPRYDYSTNYAMYIASRRMAIDMMNIYNAKYDLSPFVIRCSTVYCYTHSPYMYKYGVKIIPGYRQIYEKALKGEDIELWGDPKVKTDIVYVKDFAQLVEKMLKTSNKNSGIYNLGNGMPVSLEDQIKIAIEVFGNCKSKIIYRPEKPDGRDFVQDITKAREKLDYQPRYDYKAYLEDYKKEMVQNKYKDLFVEVE